MIGLHANEGGTRLKGEKRESSKEYPLISIITVVFNGEKYLEEAIKSVLSQSYENIEYIIIDGGSTDGTLDIIKRYEDKIAYWKSEPDKGLYDGLNKGIALSNGAIFAALHADDAYFDSKVVEKIAFEFTRDEEVSWLFGDVCIIDDGSKIKYIYRLPKYKWEYLLFAGFCYVPQPATFIKKNMAVEMGTFNIKYKLAADYDYFLRIKDRFKCKKVDCPVTKYRFHSKRLSESKKNLADAENREIQALYPLYHNLFFKAYYSVRIGFALKLLNALNYLKRYLPCR